MRRFIMPVLVVLLGVTVALALIKLFQSRSAAPPPLPPGDYEVAWIHTTTSPQTWERLVAGMHQIRREYPGVDVDDSQAFPDQTAGVPEVVLTVPGRPEKFRLRWYKLSSEVGNRDWVNALAERDTPPIAFMGGASSDRAIELAQALNERTEWKGKRPLLFITTATATADIDPLTLEGPKLIDIYPQRTFRGCFTNEAMAEAVIDFIWQQKDLKPTARAHVLAYQDDPYSLDLAEQFGAQIRKRKDIPPIQTVKDRIGFSVGTFTEPNPKERQVLDRILPDLASHPEERVLLVLPAVSQPTRRILRAFAADSPLIGRRLVAINGDGVSFNLVFRDGDVAWPVRELSIPLVLFAHQNPVAWDSGETTGGVTGLHPPSSTDDVLLFADMIRVIAQAIYLGAPVNNADELAAKLRSGQPRFYTPQGERRTGEGEYVFVVRPQFSGGGRVDRTAVFDVYTRRAGKWEHVQKLTKEYR
jgi:hypothetical protein